MMLQELFVINNVLDGKDIYSLPLFSTLRITQPICDLAKDLLIERGILKNHDEFTDEGVLVTKRLMDFKAAKKYINLVNLSIGIVDSEKAVMIRQNNDNNYDITLIDIKDTAKQFFEVFDFINEAEEAQTLDEIMIIPEKLEKEYSYKYKNFRLITKYENQKTDEMCFLSDKQLYVYDYSKQILYPKSYDDVVNLFNERLAV